MTIPFDDREISQAGDLLTQACHAASVAGGWWHDVNTGEPIVADVPLKLCLIHSEVSEALEGFRKDLFDDHLVQHKMFDVELADAAIRIFDLAGKMGIDLGTVISEKITYNLSRADHKPENRRQANGKKF